MKMLWPFALIILGIMVYLAGFAYDVLFAGIPYQDPTPALSARYEFHSQIASIIRWGGTGICMAGGILIVITLLLTRKNETKP